MKPVQQAITGNESEAETSLATPYGALAQFYRAFGRRDIALMASNWHTSGAIAMDNPLGGIARGWAEIRLLYERLFSGSMNVHVEFFDYTLHEESQIAYAVGRERGSFVADGLEVPVVIRTSRIFKNVGDQWKQVHHHGSIEDPGLLKQYKLAATSGREA